MLHYSFISRACQLQSVAVAESCIKQIQPFLVAIMVYRVGLHKCRGTKVVGHTNPLILLDIIIGTVKLKDSIRGDL